MPASKSLTRRPPAVPDEVIERRIYLIRGQKVMLDSDLAELYDVPTKRLNERVRRNRKRFPGDFMFRLTTEEAASLRSQIAISKTESESLRSQFVTSNAEGDSLRSQIATSKKGRGGRQMDFYAPTLSRFYLTSNVPRSNVRAEKLRVFRSATRVDIRVAAPEIIFTESGRAAVMRFR
jgi:ORF6N domain-containing protein